VYRTNEFAELAGVTVRTLHHYDRICLLKPAGRTAAGYRLYNDADLHRLEQIVVLKFLGLSLQQIREALELGAASLVETLASQKRALEEKRRSMEVAIEAIEAAERAVEAGTKADAQIFEIIRSVTAMDSNNEWVMQYYSPSARAKIEERAKRWTPELQAQAEKDWAELMAEVREAQQSGEDPAGPRAQALAERWKNLIEAFTAGDPEITAGLKKLYQDRANWQGDLAQKVPYEPGVQAFIGAAIAARKA
jgi:DNA-binding transcriptional MerR regulator